MKLNGMTVASIVFAAVLSPNYRVLGLSISKHGLSKLGSSSIRLNSFGAFSRVLDLQKSGCRFDKQIPFVAQKSFSVTAVCNNQIGTSLRVTAPDVEIDEVENDVIPMTILSGFLGSGKTTALKNLLENKSGVKVGVVVNDVANVNIDAKLIANETTTDQDDTVELQNGCACCSLADELLTSIQSLTTGRDFDAIVVELSGVADPVAVKENWKTAKMMSHPITKKVDVSKVVTVIDACTFGTDWMTWNTAGERDGWVTEDGDCAGQRNVPELLAEQVEAADILLINKIDLAGSEQVKVASSLAKALNKDADLFEVSFGKVEPSKILDFIAKEVVEKQVDSSCSDPKCNDPTHEHSHSHEHASADDCSDPKCTDPTHEHSHSHEHASADDCSDPKCTDPTHDHSHSHDHSVENEKHLGIVNFVYKADRPFNTQRLLTVLNSWPVPIKDDLDLKQYSEAAEEGIDIVGEVHKNPFVGVLRSKGFAWLAPAVWTGPLSDVWRHDTAMFWSHAGKHFGINTAGKWWGSISKEQMKAYFAKNLKEYERILAEDWASEEFGDRRQELVFIGASIDEDEIRKSLNDCLLSDEEMVEYRQELENAGF